MKKNFLLLLLSSLAVVVVFISCRKKNSCEGCADNNQPPIAKAGFDQVITLPIDSISLDGSLSSDPDGTISSFQWIKLSGPASFTINNATVARTVVKNLAVGAYLFELKVTDNGGLSATDTMKVIVNDPAQPNRPPVANAGPDQTIVLPVNFVTLDGSGSTDPDNNIASYTWTKISGPSSFNISNANAVQTQVTNLVQGVYQFELKVTDAGSLAANDTMTISVSQWCNTPDSIYVAQGNVIITPIGTVSIARERMISKTAGNKILFAGGYNSCDEYVSRVDIFDITNQQWSSAELSMNRFGMAAVTMGNKIFFAGGDDIYGNAVTRVDIYDAGTNSWATAELSMPRYGIGVAAASNKVFFAGGSNNNGNALTRVDIYDATSNTWSTTELSTARSGPAGASVGDKIFFGGGYFEDINGDGQLSKRMDIFNTSTNTWSIDSFAVPRGVAATILLNNKIYFAGGWEENNSYSSRVDIYDNTTQSWSVANLSQPRDYFEAATTGNKILFYVGYGTRMDIYDAAINSWSFADVNLPMQGSTIITAGNQVYVAGGFFHNRGYTNKVWRVQF